MHKGKIRWFVYLHHSLPSGEPLPPLRMLCLDEAEARKEFAKIGAIAIGREEVKPE